MPGGPGRWHSAGWREGLRPSVTRDSQWSPLGPGDGGGYRGEGPRSPHGRVLPGPALGHRLAGPEAWEGASAAVGTQTGRGHVCREKVGDEGTVLW